MDYIYSLSYSSSSLSLLGDIIMLELMIPKRILEWIDLNKGEYSRSAFVIKCLVYTFNECKDRDVIDKVKKM